MAEITKPILLDETGQELVKAVRQIAEKMKKSPKAIDNALQRIKTKIRVFQNDTLPS